MKSFFLHLKQSIFILLGLMFFINCHVSKMIKESGSNHLAFTIEAKELLQTLENNRENFTGLIFQINDKELLINKARIEEGILIQEKEMVSLNLSKVVINKLNKVKNYDSFEGSVKKLTRINDEIRFVYFDIDKIKTIASYSENLYLTSAVTLDGASIFNEKLSNQSIANYTIKVEGDYKKLPLDKENQRIIPAIAYEVGIPCPPYWRDLN